MPLFKSAINVYICLKHKAWKYTVYIISSLILDTHPRQKSKKNTKITFVNPSKNNDEKEKKIRKLERQLQSFALHANV